MSTIEEQIAAIEQEIRETPYDKSTQRHHGMLRAKIARLKDKMEASASKKTGGGGGYAIKKQGDATVVLVGPPSAGKSTLINQLTNAESKVAPYAFTTLTVIPGMLKYKGAYIQILDVPGLIEGAQGGKGRGKEVLSVIRGADLLVVMTDPERLSFFQGITNELEAAGIRINKRPPDVRINKLAGGGLEIKSNIKQEIDRDTIREVAWEFGIKNGEIAIREKLTMETLIDAFATNRVYVPAMYVLNKADLLIDLNHLPLTISHLKISAENGKGIEDLKQEMWRILGLTTVYLVKPNSEPNFDDPMIMKKGQTLQDVALKIGNEFAEGKTSAKIWGPGAKFPEQLVSLATRIQDGMQIRFI